MRFISHLPQESERENEKGTKTEFLRLARLKSCSQFQTPQAERGPRPKSLTKLFFSCQKSFQKEDEAFNQLSGESRDKDLLLRGRKDREMKEKNGVFTLPTPHLPPISSQQMDPRLLSSKWTEIAEKPTPFQVEGVS